MRYQWAAFTEMLYCTLMGHLRNRLALLLACAFIPAWITVARVCAFAGAVTFPVDTVGTDVVAPANQVGQTVNALSAVTLITGFMMFMATFKAGDMDRRLVHAGYPRIQLLLAKAATLTAVATALAAYTTVLLWLFLPVQQFWWLAFALFTAGLAYGGIGLLLGSLVHGELEGFFIVVMLSLADAGLQNPVIKVASLPGLDVLPSYGATQSALVASFTTTSPGAHPLLALAWCAGTTALALVVFHARTRSSCTVTTTPATGPAAAPGPLPTADRNPVA